MIKPPGMNDLRGPSLGTTPDPGGRMAQTHRAASISVHEIARAVALPFIKEHHYTHKVAAVGGAFFFGCFVDGGLFAVLQYGRTAARDTSFRAVVPRDDANPNNTLELLRMCRVGAKEDKGPVLLTDVMTECHAILRLLGYRYILSYSDRAFNPCVGFRKFKFKSGAIYHYAGFEHLGATKGDRDCENTRTGEIVNRTIPYRKMRAHNLALCAKNGWDVPRKPDGNRDRIWPAEHVAADSTCPPDKLWTLAQVHENLGLVIRNGRPPKDKWLLTL